MSDISRKKKLAVSISLVWAIRNVIYSGLLEKLIAEFDVYLVFRKSAPEVEELCRRMGAKVWVAPQIKETSGAYKRVLDWLAQAHKLRHDLRSEAMKKEVIHRKYSLLQKMYLWLRDVFLFVVGKTFLYGAMIRIERGLYYESHDLSETQFFLEVNKIDLFLFTAPLQSDSNEVHLMRACKNLDIRTVAMVLGFDNLTTKGRLPEFMDHYFVWNDIMRSEILRIYPSVKVGQVFVTGSPQFDFYASQTWGYTRDVFCQKMGLDPEKPIILYAANPEFLVPGEHELVADLVTRMAIDDELRNMQLILRLHPFDSSDERWGGVTCMPHVKLSIPWKTDENGAWGQVMEDDIHILVGSLRHSFCNINVSSTMSLDAVFYDRPVICPAYAMNTELNQYMRDLYDREHFIPITYSGAVQLVDSPEMLLSVIKAVHTLPDECHPQRVELTKTMLGQPIGSFSTAIKDVLLNLQEMS